MAMTPSVLVIVYDFLRVRVQQQSHNFFLDARGFRGLDAGPHATEALALLVDDEDRHPAFLLQDSVKRAAHCALLLFCQWHEGSFYHDFLRDRRRSPRLGAGSVAMTRNSMSEDDHGRKETTVESTWA